MIHFYILYNGFTNCKIIKGNYTIHTNISLLCKNYLVLLYDLQALGMSIYLRYRIVVYISQIPESSIYPGYRIVAKLNIIVRE